MAVVDGGGVVPGPGVEQREAAADAEADDADFAGAVAGACPIVASYGGRDPSLRGAAARLDTALDKAGVVHDVKEYPHASHAFLNDAEAGPRLLRPLLRVTGTGPEPDSAQDAWHRIAAFFDTHLH